MTSPSGDEHSPAAPCLYGVGGLLQKPASASPCKELVVSFKTTGLAAIAATASERAW